jgi:hypothetical protein
MDPSLANGELVAWSTPHLLNLMQASMDQLEKNIITKEKQNDELTQ